MAADTDLVRNLANAEIEGVFWIAQFGDVSVSTLELGPDVQASVAALHASMLIENYTSKAEAPPLTTWIPERDALAVSVRRSQS